MWVLLIPLPTAMLNMRTMCNQKGNWQRTCPDHLCQTCFKKQESVPVILSGNNKKLSVVNQYFAPSVIDLSKLTKLILVGVSTHHSQKCCGSNIIISIIISFSFSVFWSCFPHFFGFDQENLISKTFFHCISNGKNIWLSGSVYCCV